jgi:hypothetical protein
VPSARDSLSPKRNGIAHVPEISGRRPKKKKKNGVYLYGPEQTVLDDSHLSGYLSENEGRQRAADKRSFAHL